MIDPNIALAVRPVESPSVRKTAEFLVGLRHAATQQAAAQQQMEIHKIQIDQARQDQQDQQAVRQAFMDVQGDPDKLTARAAELGAGPKTIQQLETHRLAVRKSLAEISDKDLAAKKAQNEQFLGLTTQAMQLPDDQYAAAWPTIRAKALEINPKAQIPEQAIPKGDLYLFQIGLATQGDLYRQAEEARKAAAEGRAAALFPVRQAAAAAGLTKTQQEVSGTQPLSPYQQRQLEQGANNVSEAELQFRAAKGDATARAALDRMHRDRVTIAQNSRPIFNAGLPAQGNAATIEQVPNEIRGRVQAILNYQMPMPTASRNNPQNQAIAEWVTRLDPTYSAAKFPARQRMLTDYTSGKRATEINALNTVLGHVDVLDKAVDALHNGDVQFINSIANHFGVAVGKTPVTTFNAIVNRIGPELTRAYIGAGGDIEDRRANKADFSSSMSPEQIRENARVTARLLGGKIGALKHQWENPETGMGKPFTFMTPEAQATWDRLAQTGAAIPKNPYRK